MPDYGTGGFGRGGYGVGVGVPYGNALYGGGIYGEGVPAVTVTLGKVTRTATVYALVVTVNQVVSLGKVTRTATVQPLTISTGTVISLGKATRSAAVYPLSTTVHTVITLGKPTRASTAYPISTVGGIQVTLGKATRATVLYPLRVELGYAITSRNRVSARVRVGIGYASWEPAIDPMPASLVGGDSRDVALAFSTPVIVGTQPVYTVSQADQKRGRDRILIAGRDVTYYRGVETVVEGYQLLQPFMYGPATLTFPQVAGSFERPLWLRPEQKVKIQRVTNGAVTGRDYRGIITAIHVSGADIVAEVGGELTGPAATRFKPLPLFRTTADLGQLIWRAVTALGGRTEPRMGATTGTTLGRFGGTYYLDYLQQLLGRAWTRSGNQWTVMPDSDGVYRTTRKNRTTIHGTVYLDDTNQVGELRRDITEEPNRIYATGVTPDGQRVRFGRYPGLEQDTHAPLFPGTMSQGDSGEDVSVLLRRLEVFGYLTRKVADGGFDADVVEAVKTLQEDADLAVTGVVNQGTWFTLFDLDATGYSLKWSRIEPAAQKPYTRRYRTSASGAIIGKHEAFDRTRLVVDRDVDFGTGFTRNQMREWAKAELDNAADNWVGSITLNTGAIPAGNHTPGNPVTGILVARDIRPGMNLSAPLFAGGITVHVTAVKVAGDVVTLDVDTRARDAWTVAQVIERDRESRRDPARAFFRSLAASGVAKDAIDEWSEVGGLIDSGVDLQGGEWTVFEVVAGQAGTVRSLRLDTNPNAEFVAAVFGKKVWPKALQRLIGNPFSVAGKKAWYDESTLNRLERDHGLLYQAGDVDAPGGYSPGSKDGASIVEGRLVTGRLDDDAGFSYYTDKYPVLYVAVWSDRNTKIPGGRIMWPQLEAGA